MKLENAIYSGDNYLNWKASLLNYAAGSKTKSIGICLR